METAEYNRVGPTQSVLTEIMNADLGGTLTRAPRQGATAEHLKTLTDKIRKGD